MKGSGQRERGRELLSLQGNQDKLSTCKDVVRPAKHRGQRSCPCIPLDSGPGAVIWGADMLIGSLSLKKEVRRK